MVAQGSREIACLGAKVTKTILQYYWTYSCEYFDALNDILEAQSWGRSEEVEQKKGFNLKSITQTVNEMLENYAAKSSLGTHYWDLS